MNTFSVDDLAQEIRRINGDRTLGAGKLAEELMLFFAAKDLIQSNILGKLPEPIEVHHYYGERYDAEQMREYASRHMILSAEPTDKLLEDMTRAYEHANCREGGGPMRAAYDVLLVASPLLPQQGGEQITKAPDVIYLKYRYADDPIDEATWCIERPTTNHIAYMRAGSPQVGEVVALLQEMLAAICADTEATYNAAKEGKPLEITIGQWRRLQRAKAGIGELSEESPIFWWIPDDNGKPFAVTAYSYEASQWRTAGRTVRCTAAPAGLGEAKAVAPDTAGRWMMCLESAIKAVVGIGGRGSPTHIGLTEILKFINAAPVAQAMPVEAALNIDGDLSDKIWDAIASSLNGVYVCTRAWEAWSVGTMTEDDFIPASEDSDVIEAILDAVKVAVQGEKA